MFSLRIKFLRFFREIGGAGRRGETYFRDAADTARVHFILYAPREGESTPKTEVTQWRHLSSFLKRHKHAFLRVFLALIVDLGRFLGLFPGS